MRETILVKLESSRKELIDLGLRNSLLNYKLPTSRGLHIVQEKSSSIFNILVKQGKAMSFLGKDAPESDEIDTKPAELSETELEEQYSDTKLQTNESETTLLKRLLNTYYSAKTSLEEQGVNILYISLGMLRWYESESSQDERLAPLVLIPVSLERSSAREKFRVKYTFEEIGENISLQAKMKLEFDVTIQDIPEIEDFDIDEYFDDICKSIQKIHRWRVEKDTIELGFFSFGRFMIYNDLDNNKWPEEKKPIEHPILQNLFEFGFHEGPSPFGEETFIDTETTAHELFQVVDADSSQILTMLTAREGKNLVIQGPPGTGKSQTIANLIADAIGMGKKVLFVAEKMAALEVVKRRLDPIGLGEACLELHSHKANKKEMHKELMRVLELGRPNLQKLQQEVSLLNDYKTELNTYCTAINTEIGKSSLTAHRVIGRLLKLSDATNNISLPKFQVADFSDWDAEQMNRVESFAERIQARLKVIGIPKNLLFWGCQLKVLMPSEQESLISNLEQCKKTIQELKNDAEAIANHIGTNTPINRLEVAGLATMTYLISKQPDLKEISIKSDAWILNRMDIEEIFETGKKLNELHKKYADILLPEAWNYDVLEIRQNLISYGDKWYKFFIKAYNKSNKQLTGLCKVPSRKEAETKLQYVDDILEAKRLTALLNEHESLAKQIFGQKWENKKSDWSVLEAAAVYLFEIHQQVLERKCSLEILNHLCRSEDPVLANTYYQNLTAKLDIHLQQIDKLLTKLSFNELARFPEKSLAEQPFIEQMRLITDWLSRNEEIHLSITWNTLVETAIEEKVDFLTHLATSWEHAKDFLKIAIQKNWYEYILEQALANQSSLRRFQRDSHEEIAKQFRRLDLLNLHYNRGRAAYRHWEAVPRAEAGGQVNILKKEFNKKARFKPIRKIMEEAGLAVQAIKPVFMMSPMSIANFLPPGSVEFDLIIFDEASQVKPVEALGAILRGKQLVVVGDSKQLPPTSFFDSLTKEIEDEENVTADMQSILGLCEAQGLIPKMLRWHYRSRHESLITLSNHEFYENKLVIFPSPGSKHRMGLVFHHLKNTAYDRGKTRTNAKEAEIVADAVIEHARRNPKLSLGVVAFSTAQRQAIEDALELRRRNLQHVEPYFKSHPDEPFFIKNLENVQGDERDVIFISIGYGRTEEGYVAMSFGPLNNEGGERRLNVLITRAKLRCEIFTNITSEDIDLSRTKSYGIRTLKNFLYFAQHGKMNMAEESGLPADSPFEENVADKLTNLGYVVRKQVGSQGFFIDLAIVDPKNPGRYVIGIECDGAAYHSARSARDRDRLRQQVLENIGWKIHRIWSTDWFRNPDKELKRVVEAIETAKELLFLDDEALELDAASQIIATDLAREQHENETINIPKYAVAKLSPEIAQREIHLYSIGKLSVWIEEVVKTESPVHFDEVARRIIEAAGITKIGSRIREILLQAANHSHYNNCIRIKGDFLWEFEMESPLIRDRSNLPNSSRKIKFISPEEIALAVERVVQNAIAISPEDTSTLVANMFGFNRVTEEMRREILDIVAIAVEKKIVELDGNLLKANPPAKNGKV